MNTESLIQTVRSRFKTEVAEHEVLEGILKAVLWDNDEAATPDEGPWILFSVRLGDAVQTALGRSKRFRTPGVAIAMIAVEAGTGEKQALQVADIIRTAFRSLTDEGVTYKTPTVRTIGRSGKWWQVNVTCPFYSDDTN